MDSILLRYLFANGTVTGLIFSRFTVMQNNNIFACFPVIFGHVHFNYDIAMVQLSDTIIIIIMDTKLHFHVL